MFEAWGRFIYRRRRLVLLAAAIAVAGAAVWGTGVFGSLQSGGGFTAPGSQSEQASNLTTRAFGRDTADVVVLYRSATMTVADPAYRQAVTGTLAALPRDKVLSAVSRPNALVARSLACWLWLPGGVKPPPDFSDPNTPVPQTAAPATAITAARSTSRRRR